jgi:hypothetical protein
MSASGLTSSEDEKGSTQNHNDCRGRKAPAREGEQRRRRPAAPQLVDLLFRNGCISRPVMGEHIGPQHSDIAIAELVASVGRPPKPGMKALSLTKAAQELHVTAGALSHQIRGLEELLGVKLFERHVRSIELTPAGKLLFPGLQTGFVHIRDAVSGLRNASQERVLVISTSPGFTSKWLASRLYRFTSVYS